MQFRFSEMKILLVDFYKLKSKMLSVPISDFWLPKSDWPQSILITHKWDRCLNSGELFVGDPTWPVPRLYLNFYEYEVLIEGELCLYFTALLNNRKQPASDQLISFYKRIKQPWNYRWDTFNYSTWSCFLDRKLDLPLNSFTCKAKAAAFCKRCCQVVYNIQIFHSKRIEWPSNFRMDEFNQIQS